MQLRVARAALVAAVSLAPVAQAQDDLRARLVIRTLDELHRERFDEALATAAELREAFPLDPAGALAAANVYQTMMRDYRLRDHEPEFEATLAEARRLADAAVRARPDAEAFFARGTAQGYVAIHDSRSGRWLAALKHGLRCMGDMNEAARRDPAFVDPQLAMALHDYWKSRKLGLFFGGRRPAALARMERVWKEGRYLTVEAAYTLSAALQLEERFADALAVNDWLSERFPRNPVNLYHRARILEGLGRRDEALRAWDALVVRLIGSGRVSHGFLAEAHFRRARLLAAAPETAEPARLALGLALDHAHLRDPRRELDGPFEDFDALRAAIARLEGSWDRREKTAARATAARREPR